MDIYDRLLLLMMYMSLPISSILLPSTNRDGYSIEYRNFAEVKKNRFIEVFEWSRLDCKHIFNKRYECMYSGCILF